MNQDRRPTQRTARPTRHRNRPSPEVLEDRRLLALFLVNSNYDGPGAEIFPGTLRNEIKHLNASPDPTNTLGFDFGGANTTITLQSALPAIVKPVFINGTQTGGSTSTPSVEIVNGYNAGTDYGLDLEAGSANSNIVDMAVGGFLGGIELNSANGRVIGSELGTDLSGSTAVHNFYGIVIGLSGTGATIGGTVASPRPATSSPATATAL